MPNESIALVTGATKAVGCAEHASIGQAEKIPVSALTPVVSISPVVVPDGHFKFLHLWPGQNPPLDSVVIA
jgi:hypothetical protein